MQQQQKQQMLQNAKWHGSKKPKLLIFDVNETLIDFESMHPLFERVFGDKKVMREWLGHLIMYSMTLTMSGIYKDYWAIGGGLFHMVGEIHEKDVKDEDIELLKEAMKTMPAHKDAEDGLKKLKAAGYRLVTLTNSPPTPDRKTPLENAGLAKYFERQFNGETALAYKPLPIVYHMVTDAFDLAPDECFMVATHVWDTIGAQAAGLSAGLLTRSGNAPLYVKGIPQPNVIAKDLPGLADEMEKLWGK
ncbi:MAG TPA: haloacid dehalogenase type II [Puia sp.]